MNAFKYKHTKNGAWYCRECGGTKKSGHQRLCISGNPQYRKLAIMKKEMKDKGLYEKDGLDLLMLIVQLSKLRHGRKAHSGIRQLCGLLLEYATQYENHGIREDHKDFKERS